MAPKKISSTRFLCAGHLHTLSADVSSFGILSEMLRTLLSLVILSAGALDAQKKAATPAPVAVQQPTIIRVESLPLGPIKVDGPVAVKIDTSPTVWLQHMRVGCAFLGECNCRIGGNLFHQSFSPTKQQDERFEGTASLATGAKS